MTNEMQISDAEERLRLAMHRSDVHALDDLLAPELSPASRPSCRAENKF